MSEDRDKFKIWNKKTKKWIDLDSEYYGINPEGELKSFHACSGGQACWLDDQTDEDLKIIRCTGWIDKQSHLIYEGDFLQNSTDRVCEVVWLKSSEFIGWSLKTVIAIGKMGIKHSPWNQWIIVGNKYEVNLEEKGRG